MLSQVRWPLESFGSLDFVREDRILEMGHAEISLSERLRELVTLCEESIEVGALVCEFLDESPVMGGSEIDHVTTARSDTGWIIVCGKTSDSSLGCLATARASHPVNKT